MRARTRVEMPPTYTDPALAAHDTNYAWAPMDAVEQLFAFIKATRRRLIQVDVPALMLQSHNDSTVAPASAAIIRREIATPPADKWIVWFEETEHEMFQDCERDAVVEVVVDYVRERLKRRK